MASNQQQLKGWGCLFILGGIGIWGLYFLLTGMVGGGTSNEKWGFLGIGAFCVLLGIVLLSLPGRKRGLFAQCPHCHAKCQVLCSKCGGWNLDLIFQQGQPDLDHVVGFRCGTGPRVIGGCGATMDAVTCPKCQREIPVPKLRVKVPSGGDGSAGCFLIGLVICVAYVGYSYMQARNRAARLSSPPPPPAKAVAQTGGKSQPKTAGGLSVKTPSMTNAPEVTNSEAVANDPVTANAPPVTGTVKALLGRRITIDLGKRDSIKVGTILEVEGASATELRVDRVYPRQCGAVRVRESDPLPAKGDRVHIKSQQQP
jgi:hypothetical protein